MKQPTNNEKKSHPQNAMAKCLFPLREKAGPPLPTD